MDFEEKIDAMRTTLELAILDIEAQRAGIQELRASIQDLRMLSEHQHENIQDLMRISGDLVKAEAHDKRITVVEGRLSQ
jgi:uncharacterized protein YigA (DUF484 family)